MTTESVLFALLRAAVCGEVLSEEVVAACTPSTLSGVYHLSTRHDLAHLAAHALEGAELPECEALESLKKAKNRAIYRYARMEHEYERICRALEMAKISFLPLKGSVLRAFYPEPWMRTSADIDILVHREDLEKTVHLLEEAFSYQRKGKGSHDVSMYLPNGMHLELHYETIEDAISKSAQAVLSQIWNRAVPKEPGSFHYLMPDELFYFYHIAHMAKHIRNGGCGIRYFLDIWVMNHRMSFDAQKQEALLREGQRLTFAQAAEKLSEAWFADEAPDALSRQLEAFIFGGGIHGSVKNRVRVQNQKKYPISRIVIPYEDLMYYYPVLEKKPWLMPVYQVVRWVRLMKSIWNTCREKKLKKQLQGEEANAAIQLMQDLGI